MRNVQIEKVIGREIVDSRGNPTVEAQVKLSDGTIARGAAPSGASTGEFEALELRDQDPGRFQGKGVLRAVENINTVICDTLKGMCADDIYAIDQAMIRADGTGDKSRLGANAILAVSIACARAAAASMDVPLYRFLGRRVRKPASGAHDEYLKWRRPCGQHGRCAGIYDYAGGSAQLPGGTALVYGGFPLRWRAAEEEKGLATSVGDEGGFAPDLGSDEEAIQYILEAVKKRRL